MSQFRKCIINGAKEGLISQTQAQKLQDMLNELEDFFTYQKGLDRSQAQRAAAKKTYDQLKIESAEKLRATLLQRKVMDQIQDRLLNYRNSKGEVDVPNAVRSMYAHDNYSTEFSIERLVDMERGKAHALMNNILDQLAYKIGGRQTKLQKTNLKLMIRELMGENTGNQNAKQLAEAWKQTAEHLRKRYNSFGGKILSRKDWGLPQIHDTLLVRSVAKQDWIDYVLPKLDLDKMTDESTGLPFTDKSIQKALNQVYDNISTEGMATFKPGTNSYGKTFANRRTDHRFLAFKNADAWMEYQTRFGNPDPFVTMMEHINGMSRDIALLKTLGPNPDATHSFLLQTIKKQSTLDTAAEAQGKFKRKKTKLSGSEQDRANAIVESINNLYAYHKGTLNQPVNAFFGNTFAGLRQILTSAQLGGASIMALSDFNWSRITSKFNGLPSFKANKMATKLLYDGIKKDSSLSRTAMRLGLIAEMQSTVAGVQARYLDDIDTPMLAKRISDVILRGSGLSHLTQSGKWGFGMSVLGTLADESGKVFNKLDPDLQKALTKYGIDDEAWDIIRATKLYDAGIDEPSMVGKNITFLRPDDIHARADLAPDIREDLTTRLMNFVTSETNFAVPTASAKGRTILAGSTKAGTVPGELMKSVLMYKNFAITLGYTHLARGFQQVGLKGKFKYLVPMIVTGGVMGALAYELKQIAAGKKPTEAKDMGVRYWINSLVYGGGLGIFGDFLFADQNRYGGSLQKTASGPVVGFLHDAIQLTIGNAMQLASGEKTNAGKELAAFIQRYTPGSTLWYTRLAFERLIIDTLERLINPDFDADNRRKERNLKNRTGQEYWWSPGEITPN